MGFQLCDSGGWGGDAGGGVPPASQAGSGSDGGDAGSGGDGGGGGDAVGGAIDASGPLTIVGGAFGTDQVTSSNAAKGGGGGQGGSGGKGGIGSRSATSSSGYIGSGGNGGDGGDGGDGGQGGIVGKAQGGAIATAQTLEESGLPLSGATATAGSRGPAGAQGAAGIAGLGGVGTSNGDPGDLGTPGNAGVAGIPTKAEGPFVFGAIDKLSKLTISTTSLPAATADKPYSATMKASGGAAPYAWSVFGLPLGLTLNSSTGKITGSPTSSGTFQVIVQVSEGAAPPASRCRHLFAAVAGG